jgi:hypothetical protein
LMRPSLSVGRELRRQFMRAKDDLFDRLLLVRRRGPLRIALSV